MALNALRNLRTALTATTPSTLATPTAAKAPRTADGDVLLEAAGLTKSYAGAHGELPVLAGIDLKVRAGEVVALLGKSGSGKSTLLRCLAGLVPASSGTVTYRDKPLTGANPGTAMVFQTFALLPWLTVQQNVELGLEARGIPADQRAEAAVQAIDLIGLDGFESAYPKELSGGMRQRVGFARALVVEPDVLMMDEPFSALDVLTAENLRGELMELWESGQFPTRAIVLVTHNIEEAVLMADRIVVLGSRPYGTIRETFEVGLDRPRDRNSPAFEDLIDRVYRLMTGRTKEVLPQALDSSPNFSTPLEQGGTPCAGETPIPGISGRPDGVEPDKRTTANAPLPRAGVDGLSGLAEMVAHRNGRCDLADLADDLGLAIDDVLPLVDALELLGFAKISDNDLLLTERGTAYAGADVQRSKTIFAEAAMEAPLVRLITTSLRQNPQGTLRAGFFRDVLAHHYTSEQVTQQLETATDWGRYAELYAYDADPQEYHLDNGQAADAPQPYDRS
ncbi:nitrate/sulfonate/bicarbonate ABC transporter ATP-binding protein [Streptomyces sp. NPDC050636]|uniref:ABC transporter ATP-binding protein n=1 Tax=Streptomyces sp. NPDC050636 TaxID=3154510 RepID=UPI003435D7D5